MEKEFVPYQPSLDLKELGFDEDCFGYFHQDDYVKPIITNIAKGQFIKNSKACSAPTFSQAFRFFREKYKISGEISSDYYLEGKDNEWEYNIYQLGKEDDGYVGTIPIFKTPEDAELACLKKLIEIVKEKS